MNILEDKYNNFFKRQEIKLIVEAGKNPTYDEAKKTVAEQTKKSEDLVEELSLCKKHTEQCQKETRLRASLSFYAALIAMFFGFGFIFWGGYYILTSFEHLAVGSAVDRQPQGIQHDNPRRGRGRAVRRERPPGRRRF